MRASDTFSSPDAFISRLRLLRKQRRARKLRLRGKVTRASLSKSGKDQVLRKTKARCHICGGRITGKWHADHVFAHALGGAHDPDNFLPAHAARNKYRWFYGAEEFQWILKLGVWLRTQIEKDSHVGGLAAEAFCTHERRRAGRRRKQ
jgi:5-methylcytosine-specific restriction endonuclease McrA